MNRTRFLPALGQSLWLDYIRRDFLLSGELQTLIEQDNLSGVTTNPAIFDEAVAEGDDYDASLRASARRGDSPVKAFRRLAVTDVQYAADKLRDVYERTEGRDGFVSLEVSPRLADNTDATVTEARELWTALERPNVMIKVPGTEAGLPAITRLIAEGVNVNVTLLFGLKRYEAVARAYLAGLERRHAEGRFLGRVASVASFFLSRIDLLADEKLEELARERPMLADRALALRGRVAIASAKVAYSLFNDIFSGPGFGSLEAAGARPQRLLWASTSTKTPGERDTRYVEALIGPRTINTVPLKTLEAFRDHGDAAPRLADGLRGARAVLAELDELGIDLAALTARLEREGVQKFSKPFDHLLKSIEAKLAVYCP